MKRIKKRIAVLGSTGSIGRSSLEVIEALGDDYELAGAGARRNWQLLARQARQYSLAKVVLTDPTEIEDLKNALADTDTRVLGGPESLIELAADPSIDTIILSLVGIAGLPALLAAVEAGKTIALANKESLVLAGSLIMPLAQKYNAGILPIDSEHSAILQAMRAGGREEVEKIIITCSGGPFCNASVEELAQASLAEALNHPTWQMGTKITIDSATMMNKALEIVEARWLFDLEAEQIEVLIHPESIIHSMVEFRDGSVIAQLSPPDMRLPIQYALTYPQRQSCPVKRLDLSELGQLTFQPPDLERFPALRLGFEVARQGGTCGAVLNGANEAAVEAFGAQKITFNQITELTEQCLRNHNRIKKPNFQQLLEADKWARNRVRQILTESELTSNKIPN